MKGLDETQGWAARWCARRFGRLHVAVLLGGLCAYMVGASVFAQTVFYSSDEAAEGAQLTVKRMDFAFQDIPVRALLQVLGETAGVNIVVGDSVQGVVSLNLHQATWQEAVQVVARAKNLQLQEEGSVLYVHGEKLTVSTDSNPALGQGLGMSAQGEGEMQSRFTSNQQQVLIEARIVEAEDSFSRSLGVKLGFNDLSRTGYTTTYQSILDPNGSGKYIDIPVKVPVRSPSRGAVVGGNLNAVRDLSGQTSGVVGLGQLPNNNANSLINFPAAIATSGTDPASFAVSLFGAGMNRFINLEISALETDGKGKIISNPRVVTRHNVRAVIEQGTEVPYQQTNALGATNTSFRKASLKLEVTPQISRNGEVTLAVDVTKDSVGVPTSEGYTINTKHVQTQVKIQNGGTLVIGGIYQEDSRNAVEKVPLLGDLPLLGHLFKTTTRSINKTELLIFLTPHILDARGNVVSNASQKSLLGE